MLINVHSNTCEKLMRVNSYMIHICDLLFNTMPFFSLQNTMLNATTSKRRAVCLMVVLVFLVLNVGPIRWAYGTYCLTVDLSLYVYTDNGTYCSSRYRKITGNCDILWIHKSLITGGKQMGSPMTHCWNYASHLRHYAKTFIENSAEHFPLKQYVCKSYFTHISVDTVN